MFQSKTASDYGISSDLLQFLSLYLGMGFLVGTCTFGYLIIRRSDDCAISRRHLCQLAALACGVSSLLFTMSTGYKGHALYSWAYGIFCGGYQYSLKMYTYELVKAKMMERAWSFVCLSQFLSYLLGSPISSKYINY